MYVKKLYEIVEEGQKVKVEFQEQWKHWYKNGEFTVGKEYDGEIRMVDKDSKVLPCVCISFKSNNGDWSGEIWVNEDEEYYFIKFNYKTMVIENRNGTFSVNAAQYNYLPNTFEFNEINSELVGKTNFVNSTWEYKRADDIFKNNEIYRDKLKVFIGFRSTREQNRFSKILAIATLFQQDPDWEDAIKQNVKDNCQKDADRLKFPYGWQCCGSYETLKQWFFQNCR